MHASAISLSRLRAAQGPTFKIPLRRSYVPRPTEYRSDPEPDLCSNPDSNPDSLLVQTTKDRCVGFGLIMHASADRMQPCCGGIMRPHHTYAPAAYMLHRSPKAFRWWRTFSAFTVTLLTDLTYVCCFCNKKAKRCFKMWSLTYCLLIYGHVHLKYLHYISYSILYYFGSSLLK